MTHQSITWITSQTGDDCSATTQELSARTGVNFTKFKTVGELFTSLSSPQFSTDLIVVDLDIITKVEGTDLFDIISTISTLIKCTVQRINPGKPVKRAIPIAVSANLETDPDLFKQIAGTEVIGVYPCGSKFTVEDKIAAVTVLLTGQCYMPPAIAERIKPAAGKKANKKSTITLTARQAQILQLICNRGASNKVIANTLKISESTVKLHITAVLKKYGVRNRTQLALFANKQKLVQPV